METSEDIGKRWETECASRLPAYSTNRVVFSYGVNDTTINDHGLRVTAERSGQNSREILSRAAEKYQVLMVGPPPIDDALQNERIQSANTQFQQICGALNIAYLSVFETLLNEPIWMKEVAENDGAHPRAGGYQCFASIVYQWEGWVLS
jgi:lysophospholipase L1-like esterase